MATHTFYLSWQVEYDYSRPEMLTGEREKLLSLLRRNGFHVSFADCWNSEKYLPEKNRKKGRPGAVIGSTAETEVTPGGSLCGAIR